MDVDPAVEPELDGFSLILPLPYRIAVIFVLGIWAWGLNLHYLAVLKIDVSSLIRYPTYLPGPGVPPPHLRTYRLAILATIPLLLSLALFWAVTHRDPALVLRWSILPQSYLVLLCLLFLVPVQRISKAGRYRFLATLRRIGIGGLAKPQDGRFGDIILADVLTSYAKVLGDVFVSACMIFARGVSSTAKPHRSCGGMFVVPFVISVPSLIRLRQCLIEYRRVRRGLGQPGGNQASTGWGGQHLANAFKYASAFPVVILSALQRGYDPTKMGISETGLFRLWLLFVLFNSLYSFYWDVAKDWDLTLFASASVRNSPEHPYGLRRHTPFHSKEMYYSAIVVDLLLRCTWSLKLSPHLDHWNDLEGSIFVMEVLEVGRRWMWIFLRVETEWVRINRGPAPDEILLGDYTHREEDRGSDFS